MSEASAPPVILPFARLDLVRDPAPWAFAEARRPAIDAHFDGMRAANPALWNGRVLLLARHAVSDGALSGAYCETDFASFMWWRDTGFPDPAIRNAFAMGALSGSDGGFVLGRMAAWTANPGRIYFAAGTPEPGDVLPDGTVDLGGSVMRELAEETGLGPDDVEAADAWHGVFDGPRIALMRRLVAPEPAERVAARIREHIAREDRPELADVVIARGPADISDAMPRFIRAYLASVWQTS
ncbi:NUDIX hydrolase [Ancylobacter terrae]|uniref:NUDIX hydrolase n=1 Tax=Ancylobacter sp. sgz301288 TaxID=3342077 RepID=UPI00385D1CA4